MFKSFNVGSETIVQEQKQVVQYVKIETKKEPKKENTNSELFLTKEIFFEKSIPIVKKPEIVKEKQQFNVDDTIFSIASNYSSAYLDQANKYFNAILDAKLTSPRLSTIFGAKKVILASKNGMVLLFDDKLDANLLNRDALKPDFISNSLVFTGKPYFILGIDKSKLMNMKNE
jgi:hypothetical protein